MSRELPEELQIERDIEEKLQAIADKFGDCMAEEIYDLRRTIRRHEAFFRAAFYTALIKGTCYVTVDTESELVDEDDAADSPAFGMIEGISETPLSQDQIKEAQAKGYAVIKFESCM